MTHALTTMVVEHSGLDPATLLVIADEIREIATIRQEQEQP